MTTINRDQLVCHINQLLAPNPIKDYCPNGLQLEGKNKIGRIVTGVTASLRLIEAAISQQADAILVHHGIMWKNDPPEITGVYKQKIAKLLAHDINLLAYHLPLDVHASLGNNAQLGKLLGITNATICDFAPQGLLWQGNLPHTDKNGLALFANLQQKLQHTPLHISANRPITKVVWCTGAAQQFIKQAHMWQADAFISGEVSEPTVHFAQEHQMHYFAAGHHATERGGVQALGTALAKDFGIAHQFIDIPIPV